MQRFLRPHLYALNRSILSLLLAPFIQELSRLPVLERRAIPLLLRCDRPTIPTLDSPIRLLPIREPPLHPQPQIELVLVSLFLNLLLIYPHLIG